MKEEEPRIGVYVCECGVNISATVDVKKVAERAKSFPHVVVSRDYRYMCSDPGQSLIKDDVRELKLNRVVVASCSPRMHEPTFRAAVEEVGLNPFCLEMANIREHCSWIHTDREEATEKATQIVRLSVARAALLQPLERIEVGVTPAALVIGAGISGVEAAKDIAERGFKVYLVEREPLLGGHTVWHSKIFPLRECEETCTGSCPSCFVVPGLEECARNPNIEIFVRSEVVEVDGYIGNFKVKIRRKPTYVHADRCVACGLCSEACPVTVPNEYNNGLDSRKAIYIPFSEAVPRSYIVDKTNCSYFTGGDCRDSPACVKVCDWDAIDLDQGEEEIEVEVGAIVVATGYDLYDPSLKPELRYDHPRVITGSEFERISSHIGPTGGEIIVDGVKPKRVAFIQCVGSRERTGNTYCSRVCCMYTAKQAHTVRKNLPDAEVVVYYTDVRTFGKEHEEFFQRVIEEGVEYRQRELEDPIEVVPNGDKLIVKAEGHEDFDADLVVLATAMVPRSETTQLCRILNISTSSDGFFMEAHPKLRPIDTFTDGIFLAGCCQSPKDMVDSIAQASGAAARACGILSKDKLSLGEAVAISNEELCTGCGMCAESCQFGAISLEDRDGRTVAIVNDAVCKGCGTCIASCPNGAMQQQHYTDEQLLAMISALSGGVT